MSRNDKIGALALGVLLFAGLFYFIFTTMRNPLPADLGAEDLTAGDTLPEEDLTDEGTTDEDIPAPSTGTVTAPVEAPEPAKK